MDSSKIFNCDSYNCLGYKRSSIYVDMLCRIHDICILCEHWLGPHEVPTLKSSFESFHFNSANMGKIRCMTSFDLVEFFYEVAWVCDHLTFFHWIFNKL